MLQVKVCLFVMYFLYSISSFCSSPDIPIIFIHKGNSFYLKDSLWQAKQYNKRVILLGDESNNQYPEIEFHLMNRYSSGAQYLAQIYKHFGSLHTYDYQLFCFQRWFILKEFMEANNIPMCFYCDSDIMLYCNISEENMLRPYDLALIIDLENGGASGHSSFWKNIDILHQFCAHILYSYMNQTKLNYWENFYHTVCIPNNWEISDMNALSEFGSALWQRDKNAVMSLEKIIADNSIYDVNINEIENSTDYDVIKFPAMQSPVKNITWTNNLPYCYNKKLKKFIRFKTLHFQGAAKVLMHANRQPNLNLK